MIYLCFKIINGYWEQEQNFSWSRQPGQSDQNDITKPPSAPQQSAAGWSHCSEKVTSTRIFLFFQIALGWLIMTVKKGQKLHLIHTKAKYFLPTSSCLSLFLDLTLIISATHSVWTVSLPCCMILLQRRLSGSFSPHLPHVAKSLLHTNKL